jgi:hypothetical protein
MREGGRARRLSFHAIVVGGFLMITVIVTYPLILYLPTHVPFHPELPPSTAEHWTWTWGFWFIKQLVLEGKTWSFFTDAVFYPRGVDLTYPVLFGLGLPLAVAIPFVRFLGIVLTFNLIIFITFTVAAYSTFLLVNDLTKDSRAAFISAFIFAFSPFQMARIIGHFGIATSGMWIPLYLLFFTRATTRGNTIELILTPLVMTFAFISNPYYAIFLGLFTIIYCVYHIFFKDDLYAKQLLWKKLFPMGCLAVFFLLPLVWITFTHGREEFYFYSPISEANDYSADLLAFFLPSAYHSIFGHFVHDIYFSHFTGNVTEQTIYLGYMVLVLSIIAIVKVHREKTRFWAIIAIAFFVLSLGPFLHINGRDTLALGGMSVWLPLPNLLFYFIPLVKAMRVPSRFSIVLIMALSVLAGHGVAYLLKRVEGKRAASIGVLGLIIIVISFEFSILPVPLVDARIPKVYEGIAQERSGTLLDVPLYWSVGIYQHYQTVHHKRLLYSQVPRLPPLLVLTYAESIPFVKLFRNPELIKGYAENPVDKADILRFIEFFDLSYIVIHKDLLEPWFYTYFVRYKWDSSPPSPPIMQASEIFDRLLRFLMTYFPVAQVEEDGNIVVLKLAREHQVDALWMGKDGYILDFGSTSPQVFLSEGWSYPEHWEELTFAWAEAKESRLWVYLPRVAALSMELRIQPFTFPGSPPQGMKIYVNGRFLHYISLASNDWRSYTLHLSQADLIGGINNFRFVYDYTAAPVEVLSGNGDQRQLAVNFDYIAFHPE